MSDRVRQVNAFFKSANRKDIDNILAQVVFSDRQKNIFDMYYIRRLDAGFIADSLNVSYSVVKSELNGIRNRISCIIH